MTTRGIHPSRGRPAGIPRRGSTSSGIPSLAPPLVSTREWAAPATGEHGRDADSSGRDDGQHRCRQQAKTQACLVRHIHCPPWAPTRREHLGHARLAAWCCQVLINIAARTSPTLSRWDLEFASCGFGPALLSRSLGPPGRDLSSPRSSTDVPCRPCARCCRSPERLGVPLVVLLDDLEWTTKAIYTLPREPVCPPPSSGR